jgi:hypothetical protein
MSDSLDITAEQAREIDPLDITAEQAREIVLDESQKKGWARPELRQSQNPEVQELLVLLRNTRESLGDTVDMYACQYTL